MTLGSEYEKIEVWTGIEEIVKKSIQVMANIKTCYDLCVDSTGPAVILSQPAIKDAYFGLKQRRIPIRIITEVTKENLGKVKDLMTVGEIRHLDSIIGNFVIADKAKYAGSPETENGTLTRLIACNIQSFVKQQQYFFDMLWNKAIPVDSRISELEQGKEPELTEVWRDESIITSRSLDILRKLEKKYDFCIDWRGPSIIMTVDIIKKAYFDIVARGGKLRLITEILPDNIAYCKEIAQFMELRHLDNIKGNFGIVDEKIYGGTATIQEKQTPLSYLHSTVTEFVKQQQYFFETLWEKAIPGAQRIREIEEGVEPEITEIVSGWDNITKRIARGFSRAEKQVDSCCDSMTPEMMIKFSLDKTASDFVNRGGKVRLLTDIAPDNLQYVKELQKNNFEVRHLQGIRANFGVSENEYNSPASVGHLYDKPQVMFSNSKDVIKQHHYLFDIMWNKAMPAEDRIREIEEGVEPEITEIIFGANDFIIKTLECYAREDKEVNVCGDSTAPSSIIVNSPVMEAARTFVARGGKISFITEIIPSNVEYCRELMKTSEVRHLDGIRSNFGVSGKDYLGYIISHEGKPTSQVIHSTVKKIIEEQRYLFNTLWNKAMPAEARLSELKEGIEPENTEIVNGWDNILGRLVKNFSRARDRVDSCCDSSGPAMIVQNSLHKAGVDFVKGGGKIRLLTEITAENLPYVKELMETHETRHLQGLRANFGVSENDFTTPTSIGSPYGKPQCIFSNSKEAIRQHQYLFDTLWNNAIPAEERIRQIKEGIEPGRIEIIPDTQKSIARALDVMTKTRKELLVLFATSRTYSLAMTMEAVQLYRKLTDTGVKVRILVPRSEEKDLLESIAKTKEIAPDVDLRISNAGLNTKITILVSDRKEFMSWDLIDDTLKNPYAAGGLATYSNIESIASSYATIFDNLWILTEFSENLRLANIKLENNEKAMREFINIAAHELRTPIQPILGLSEVLQNAQGSLNQKDLLEVILRNAHRLQRLAEDILDVTRIESGKLRLEKNKVNLYEIVKSVVNDFQRSVGDRVTIEIIEDDDILDRNGKKIKNKPVHQEQQRDQLIVFGDQGRLVQVLSNLLSNAIKFTKASGTIKVRVIAPAGAKTTVGVERQGEEKAIIVISDEGPGIDPEVFPRLFERFVSKSEQGTGLGLYLSKKILEAHGGKIWAENNKDQSGATFSFSLPITPDNGKVRGILAGST